jgi:hypothetical protein
VRKTGCVLGGHRWQVAQTETMRTMVVEPKRPIGQGSQQEFEHPLLAGCPRCTERALKEVPQSTVSHLPRRAPAGAECRKSAAPGCLDLVLESLQQPSRTISRQAAHPVTHFRVRLKKIM